MSQDEPRLLPYEFLGGALGPSVIAAPPNSFLEDQLSASFDSWMYGRGPGPGGSGNRAFRLRHALALGGERVPPLDELHSRAPLKAVAAWMVRWRYLRHDDLPVGWEAVKDGTKAHKYLRSAVDAGIAAQESPDEQRGSMDAAVAEAIDDALLSTAVRKEQHDSRWGSGCEPQVYARLDAANVKAPRITMAAALASATAVAQKTAAELHGGDLGALLDDDERWAQNEWLPALEESAAAQNAGAGGRGNRAFAIRHALKVAGDRVPSAVELPLRAPLNAVAAWMVQRKYLRHDNLPVGWEAAKYGTKAYLYLQSAVDAGIAARGSSELVWKCPRR
jgi:hypothetical protein